MDKLNEHNETLYLSCNKCHFYSEKVKYRFTVAAQSSDHLYKPQRFTVSLNRPPQIFKNARNIKDNACCSHYSCNKYVSMLTVHMVFYAPPHQKEKLMDDNSGDLGG
ncbi:hypothetical protein TNIN_386211 [Trichonephila inaurata madagascariensis]|uniref:Uncharacterized protein n=1 Tax=Trichonephila inaurata madagascariensis TaxID=2747483 RepID=A0A8X6Y9J0_9ARAC|nr:hypothetical protein TNIN_386211 [Trichonephila inaurata madagascariensis]